MNKSKILIIGKVPPPIGGVTMFTSRLLAALPEVGFRDFHHLDLGQTSIINLFRSVNLYKIIHLNTSNSYLQFLLALYCFFTNKKLIITYLGNIGRYRFFRNSIVSFSILLSYIPIVQNSESLAKANRYNRRATLISSYIEDKNDFPVPEELTRNLNSIKAQYEYLFCTNAWNVTFDKRGKEIYGITDLINLFDKIPNSALFVCDPSSNYLEYVKIKMSLPSNVIFVSTPYTFVDIAKNCHAYIRNTTTDGDSISIHETLQLGKVVFATDCTSRPPGCRTYSNYAKIDFIEELRKELSNPREYIDNDGDTLRKIIKLYEYCLKKLISEGQN